MHSKIAIVAGAARGIGLTTSKLLQGGWRVAMAIHSQEIIDAYHDAIPLNRYGIETEIAGFMFGQGQLRHGPSDCSRWWV